MSTFVHSSVEYVVINCGHPNGGCGVSFAVTRGFYDNIESSGAGWFCPNGHSRRFVGPTAADRLAKSEARELALLDQLSAAIRDADATRVALLRDRARFAAGVCPCCNRSFENVRRHMVTKHPDYDVTQVHHERVALAFKCSCGRAFKTLRGLRGHQGHQRATSGSYRWDKPDQRAWAAHLTKT